MCYAIPGKVTILDGERATVDYGGVTKEANITLLDEVALGDYVLVHAGFAIERLDPKSAERAIEEIRDFIDASEASSPVPDEGDAPGRSGRPRETRPEPRPEERRGDAKRGTRSRRG